MSLSKQVAGSDMSGYHLQICGNVPSVDVIWGQQKDDCILKLGSGPDAVSWCTKGHNFIFKMQGGPHFVLVVTDTVPFYLLSFHLRIYRVDTICLPICILTTVCWINSVSHFPALFFLHLFWKRPFEDKCHGLFLRADVSQSHRQQCQSTEGNAEHWSQLVAWHFPFVIHHWTSVGRSISPNKLALQWQYHMDG